MKLKKIYCFMLAIMLVINAPIIAYADSTPGTISVSGGTIGSGGVEGNSGVLKGTALAVVMATLASVGVSVKLAADDYARGNTAINYVQNKFQEWEANADRGWDAYQALNNTKVGANGELYVPEEASDIINKFINWVKAGSGIESMPEADLLFGSINMSYWKPNNTGSTAYNTMNGATMNLINMLWNGSYYAVAWNTYRFTVRRSYNNATASYEYPTDYGNEKFALSLASSGSPFAGLNVVSSTGTNLSNAIGNLMGAFSETPDTNISHTGFYGEAADIPSLVDESGTGKILIIQPGLIPQVQDSYVGSNNASINIQDYLDALTDLYGQQAIPQDITDLPDISIPGEDAITGTKEDVAVIDRDVVLAPDLTVPADPGAITWPEVPDIAVPIVDPATPADTEIAIPAMTVDLTKIFPFCIPWDLYNLLTKFNAEPVTPSITIDWGNILGSIGVDFETTLDLHDYDGVAQVLRTMETVAFIIGLAVATRSIFLHS